MPPGPGSPGVCGFQARWVAEVGPRGATSAHPGHRDREPDGGVGKTTTVAGLGAALASRGHRVLLIDLDPQANLTSSLGVAKDLRGTYEVLMREVQLGDAVVDVSAACLRSVPDGACVSLVPASPDLAGTDTELASATDRAGRLRSAVIPYAGSYAFVLVDCPPSLGTLTLNGLVAA
ncbi:MAG: ParA family protein, partial [Chloroflexota bacterium]